MAAKTTLNHRGYQSITPSPLISEWLNAYDGEHQLLDVGCAYGINTYKALEQGIRTVALDVEKRHLKILQDTMDPKYANLLTCVVGSLPHDLNVPDDSFSAILCTDVIHYLDGQGIEDSFSVFHQKLIHGGKLVLIASSDNFLGGIDKERKIKFHQDLESGIKWPGIVHIDDDFVTKYFNAVKSEEIRDTLKEVMPNMLHFTTVKQISEELQHRGFKIISACLGENPGHHDSDGIGQLKDRSVHVVAQKI